METYTLYLASLALFNAALFYHRHQQSWNDDFREETASLALGVSSKDEVRKFKLNYFTVYVLVMLGDWLQGPYFYSVYKDEKGLSNATVNALLITGFVCGGISASFVGSLADKHGRRLACLTFCAAYSLSCLSVLSNDMLMLFIGRALGGLSTTLLYSVFETWMIAEFHSRELGECLGLSDMFSSSVTLSSVVAIIAGVLGEALVGCSGTKKSPFLAAVLCFGLALMRIRDWDENYGDPVDPEKSTSTTSTRAMLLDRRIFALAFVTTIFEGSMYLWVCFWVPALKATRAASNAQEQLPFGLIFSCFMCCMMMGSMLFAGAEVRTERDSCRLLLGILALAANAFFIPALARSEAFAFWSFSLFELCIGLYFPTMARLKSDLVDGAVRAKIYGLIRLPLNAFVAAALGIASGGDSHRDLVLTAIGALLLGAFFVVRKLLI